MEKIEENISKNLKLFGTKKSKLIDEQISNKGTPSFVFMMRAANAAKNLLLMRNVKNATIFVGKGNNGTSGWNANFGNGYIEQTAVSSAGTNASNNGIFEYDVPSGFTALSTNLLL